MPTQVNCSCGNRLMAGDDLAGKRVKCRVCGTVFNISQGGLEKNNGHVRFVVSAVILGMIAVVLGISLISWQVSRRGRDEARAKLRETLVEAMETASTHVLANAYDKAAETLRTAIRSRPPLDPDDPNLGPLSEVEALLRAVDVAATDATSSEYLDRLDDSELEAVVRGQDGLTLSLSEPKIRQRISQRLALLVPAVQEKRRKRFSKEILGDRPAIAGRHEELTLDISQASEASAAKPNSPTHDFILDAYGTDSSLNAWQYAKLVGVGKGNSVRYIPAREDYGTAVAQGFVRSVPVPGWNTAAAGSALYDEDTIRIFKTAVLADRDMTIPMRLDGDDGHAVYVDGKRIGGAGGSTGIVFDLSLRAGVPVILELAGYNGPGPWGLALLRRDGSLLESTSGISIDADGYKPKGQSGGEVVANGGASSPVETIRLLSAEDREKAKENAHKFGVTYEEFASLLKATGGAAKPQDPAVLPPDGREEMDRVRATQLRVTEFLITSPRDQVHKFFASLYLTEEALIRASQHGYAPSVYNEDQKENIKAILELFKDITLFRGLPYQTRPEDAHRRIFDGGR